MRAEYQWLYPLGWPQLSAVMRFERAQGRCERCGRPHGETILHLGDGRWYDEAAKSWRSGRGRLLPGLTDRGRTGALTTKVVLATAHLDHDPSNNRARNQALGDLFRGLYRF